MSELLFNNQALEQDRECNLLISQYNLFVNMSNDLSKRRHGNNVYFLSIHTLLVSSLTVFISNIDLVSPNKYIILAALIAGVTFSTFWQRLITSFKQLNEAKFDVIHSIERILRLLLAFEEDNSITRLL